MNATRGLTRELLITTALDIVDREGLAALSMRRLGAELGVDPMAAYRHLPNKDALLDGVVEAVVSGTAIDVDASLPWQDQVKHLLRSYMATLMAHPNALPLIASRPLRTPGSLRMIERALQVMTAAGVPIREAGLMINIAGLLTAGVAMVASSPQSATAQDPSSFGGLEPAEFPVLLEALSSGQLGEGFDAVLDFAADALIQRLERAIGTPVV